MTKSSYKTIIEDISNSILNKPPIYVSLDIFEEIEEYENRVDTQFEDSEYKYLANEVKKKLKQYIEYRLSKKSISKFNFSVSDEFSIVGISKDDPRFASYSDYYHKLITIDDFLFEKFSAKYIQLLMCDFSFVSRKSADGGIDFLGKGNFLKLLTIQGQELNLKSKDFTFKVLGQAKRYNPKNKIGTKEIREFLGSVKILQESLNPSKQSAWLGETEVLEHIRLADPFLYLFITTSHYSRDSIELAEKLGIYVVDIDDIIFDLISNNIGLANQKLNYALLEEWINK